MNISKIIRLLFGISTSVFFLWLFVRNIDAISLVSVLYGVNYFWVAGALIIYGFEYVLRISRWQSMIYIRNSKIVWKDCAGPLLLSYGVNALLPLRAGDVIRCVAHTKRLGVDSGVLTATVLMERLMDFLVVLLILALALSVLNIELPLLLKAAAPVAILGSVFIVILLGFPNVLRWIANGIHNTFNKIGCTQLTTYIDNLFDVLIYYSLNKTAINLLPITILIWLLEGAVFYFIAMSLPSVNEPAAAFIAFPVGTLSTLVPSTPGYIGTFDFFVASVFEQAGNTHISSAGYALIVHFLILAPMILVGAIFLLFATIKSPVGNKIFYGDR